MTEDKKLTLKQAKWLEVFIQTGNATEAAMQAYNCKDRMSARNMGSENMAKLGISELMDNMGLTDHKLISKLSEGLEATKVISANVIAKNGEGMADANSMTKDFIDVPDMPTQHKFLDTALKLKGKYPKDAPMIAIQNNVNVKKYVESVDES